MIFYFTGTGNSRLVAELLAEELGDELFSLNEFFRSQEAPHLHSERPFVLVAPVYAWRFPHRVETFLQECAFTGDRRFYLVATVGGHAGAAFRHCRTLLLRRGMEYKGFCEVRMPDNYLIGDQMLSHEEAISKIREALPLIHRLAAQIGAGEPLPEPESRRLDRLLSGPVNWGFQHFMANSHSFTVSSACTSCGACIRSCPTRNIRLSESGVQFGEQCMFCLHCIHSCPARAIDYRGCVEKNGRYLCPTRSEILP